jgi:hypothetical protein
MGFSHGSTFPIVVAGEVLLLLGYAPGSVVVWQAQTPRAMKSIVERLTRCTIRHLS